MLPRPGVHEQILAFDWFCRLAASVLRDRVERASHEFTAWPLLHHLRCRLGDEELSTLQTEAGSRTWVVVQRFTTDGPSLGQAEAHRRSVHSRRRSGLHDSIGVGELEVMTAPRVLQAGRGLTMGLRPILRTAQPCVRRRVDAERLEPCSCTNL